MKRLKIILLCKILLYLFLIFIIVLKIFNNKKNYNLIDNTFVGTIINIQDNKLIIDGKEKLLIYTNTITFNLGDKVKVTGKLEVPSKNTNFYSFNYNNYLKSKNINYIIYNPIIEKISNNKNIFYKIKQQIITKLNELKNTSYIKAFVLADSGELDKETYQKNGISHLFAISGMHITFITSFLLKLLNIICKKENINNFIISIFLLFYMFIVSYSISVVRASLMFIFLYLNKLFKSNIKNYEILLFIMLIILAENPYAVYNVSFMYSFIISFYLIVFSNIINKQKNYVKKLLMTSLIAVLASFPITINNFHSINFFSIILNILFVPFFTYIIFPISLITILIPQLLFLFDFVVNVFNILSFWCSKINILCFSFSYMNIYMILLYYFLFTLLLYLYNKNKYYGFIFILLYFIIHYFNLYFNFNSHVVFFDVKQGDSELINIHNKTILIDTGGIKNSNYSLILNNIIPFMQSIGAKKIDYLILTHGDYDHMGEAINLVNNFKVEKVIFNCGPYNDLEKELIKVLDKKKIKYYSCIKELNIDKNKFYFLQTKEYDNENDNSNVIYTEIDGYRFMFMGDASSATEKEILDKYNLPDIDVLKVGHHGSKTSSSKEFIDEMNPKYSIISVGKNNRYGHPNKEVLDNLNNSKIYRTDENGSIMFKIKNNKLRIETCSP